MAAKLEWTKLSSAVNVEEKKSRAIKQTGLEFAKM